MCSQIPPRDEPLAIAVIPPPLSWPFANPVHRDQCPKAPSHTYKAHFGRVGVCSPLFCAIAPVVTLLHLNPRRHPCSPLGSSSRSYAVPVTPLVCCSHRHGRRLLPSSRSCAARVVALVHYRRGHTSAPWVPPSLLPALDAVSLGEVVTPAGRLGPLACPESALKTRELPGRGRALSLDKLLSWGFFFTDHRKKRARHLAKIFGALLGHVDVLNGQHR